MPAKGITIEDQIKQIFPVVSDYDNLLPATRGEMTELALLIVKFIQAPAAAPILGKWISMPAAIKLTGQARNTLRRWIDEGLIYGDKSTGRWRIDLSTVEACFNKGRITMPANNSKKKGRKKK